MKPSKEQFNKEAAKHGLVHKAAMDEDVRVAKLGAKPSKWSSKAK